MCLVHDFTNVHGQTYAIFLQIDQALHESMTEPLKQTLSQQRTETRAIIDEWYLNDTIHVLCMLLILKWVGGFI